MFDEIIRLISLIAHMRPDNILDAPNKLICPLEIINGLYNPINHLYNPISEIKVSYCPINFY